MENHISARLARVFIHSSIFLDRSIVFSKILLKLTSDHRPILLALKKEEDLGPLPFRFSLLWAGRDGFLEIVQTAWYKEFAGSPSFVWEKKLKNVKYALKYWIKKAIKTLRSQRKEVVQQLADFQFGMEKTEVSSLELDKEKVSQKRSYSSFRREE